MIAVHHPHDDRDEGLQHDRASQRKVNGLKEYVRGTNLLESLSLTTVLFCYAFDPDRDAFHFFWIPARLLEWFERRPHPFFARFGIAIQLD